MGKLKIEPFTMEVLERYSPRPCENYIIANKDYMRRIAGNSMTIVISVIETSEVVAIIGIAPLWPGVGEVWMLGSDLISKYKKDFIRYTIQNMFVARQEANFHRLQCTVFEDFPEYCRYAEFLGFKYEGIMHAYGPRKENAYRYGMVI
jgi:RimJ/RimL family protein N-acetyltransferase